MSKLIFVIFLLFAVQGIMADDLDDYRYGY